MHKISQCFRNEHVSSYFIPRLESMTKVVSLAIGIIGGSSLLSSKNVVRAEGWSHLRDHIMEHAIWEYVGHVMHLGSFATTLLGSLLSSQSLGGGDMEVYIPQKISQPTLTKCFDERLNGFVDCIVLPNGKQILAPEFAQFLRDLQSAQFVGGKR